LNKNILNFRHLLGFTFLNIPVFFGGGLHFVEKSINVVKSIRIFDKNTNYEI